MAENFYPYNRDGRRLERKDAGGSIAFITNLAQKKITALKIDGNCSSDNPVEVDNMQHGDTFDACTGDPIRLGVVTLIKYERLSEYAEFPKTALQFVYDNFNNPELDVVFLLLKNGGFAIVASNELAKTEDVAPFEFHEIYGYDCFGDKESWFSIDTVMVTWNSADASTDFEPGDLVGVSLIDFDIEGRSLFLGKVIDNSKIPTIIADNFKSPVGIITPDNRKYYFDNSHEDCNIQKA